VTEDTLPQEPEEPEDDMDAVADRLEAALERIAKHLDAARPDRPSAALAARLDGLIARLREVLGRLSQD
jgi:hypothetical protein